ncbi:MAG: CapA family protein, partial [Lachnospiraceae bacterium]|nr:CapA family protein [Lachnospiraceae bacterium]
MRKIITYIVLIAIMSGLTGCGRGSQPDFDVSEELAQSSVASMEATPAPTPESTPEVAPSTPEPTEEPTPEPEPEQITLLMVGDILLHTPVEKSAKREDGSYSYDAIFANTKDLIAAADLALVNQEVILGGMELGISGYPRF